MAIGLQNMTQTDPPAGVNEYGAIRDNPGDNSGTPVEKKTYNDVLVFFERLMALANILPNGSFDQQGAYQLMEALESYAMIVPDTAVKLRTKIVQIGDWNMDTTQFVSVAHGIADYKKIRSVHATVRNDGDTQGVPLNTFDTSGEIVNGGVGNWGSTNVLLVRKTGGFFDNTGYDSTGYNRGWITILYEA